MQSTPTYVALTSYDLLLHLFDQFHWCNGPSRASLASCARVCRAWQEPASYVLWRKLPALHPLWNLLAARNFSPESKWLSAYWQYIDADDFVKNVITRDRERWNYFLRRASHVREVGIAACGPSELALVRALTGYNKGKSLLPSLQRLSWRHAVPTDTSVLLFSSPSLRDLEVAVSRLGTETGMTINSIVPAGPPRVDPMFIGLSEAAPLLHRLTLSGRQGPGPAIVPHIVKLTHLRELLLYNQSININPEQMSIVFENLCDLESLHAFVVDFSNPAAQAYAPSLRSLRLKGESLDLQGVLSGYLNVPHLRSLILQASDEHYTQKSHNIFHLITQASFALASSLRAISITQMDDPIDVVWNDSHSTLLLEHRRASLRPARARRRRPLPCERPHAVRRRRRGSNRKAWKRVQKLHIAYAPFRAHTHPPLTSLRHFADHCPEPVQLSMTELAIFDTLGFPVVPREGAPPLRFLDLKIPLFVTTMGEGCRRRSLRSILIICSRTWS
ncbi:hypothetical protein BD310DRAFT_1037922 [Dichomitus squalens]|uniref:F-box domain-containing protein n=1 Tax=Dichomitus squalens TaxID=114155 RepID=A0A4Q9PZH5_9APHY|nr:hypothetical protein BD310DRAFT_1037922 [Dichomitus squalens]